MKFQLKIWRKEINFLLILFSFFHYSNCTSQGFTNHWVMGYGNGWGPGFGGTNIDFTGSNINIYYKYRTMNIDLTNAVISDPAGNLMFYCNGIKVHDSTGTTMPNGNGLNPGPFATTWADGLPLQQGNVVIPMPGEMNKYYLFHETCTNTNGILKPLELFYSIIDMSLNNGFGDITLKNQIVLQDTLFLGELNATRHANGRDWWLLFRRVNSDKFYKLLITPSGINIYSQNIGALRDLYGNGAGDFSPDGSKFAYYNPKIDIEIYDFDRCTGMLSNYINVLVNDSAVFGSVAFSGNSKVLYVTSIRYIYQIDLTSANIPASMQTVAVWDGFYSPSYPFATNFLMAELGPDNKIYINCSNTTSYLHSIDYPDSLGLSCNILQHNIQLSTYNSYTIPNHPNYYLGPVVGGACDSLTGIQDVQTNTIHIRINPNPAKDKFYLNYTLPYGVNALATVYNTLGQPVMRKSLYWYFGYLQVDCNGLENGLYFVEVEAGAMRGAGKLVIAR